MSNDVSYETEVTNDLSNADIVRPQFDNVRARCIIGDLKVEVKTSADGSKIRELLIPLTLDEPTKSTDERIVQPGFVIQGGKKPAATILLTPVGGLTQEMINEKLAKFQVAALKLTKQEANLGDLSRYAGLPIVAVFGLRRDKNDASKTYQDVKGWAKVA